MAQQRAPHYLPVAFSGEKGACPFCSSPGFIPPTCSSCGVSCGDTMQRQAKRGRAKKGVNEAFIPSVELGNDDTQEDEEVLLLCLI